mgnify:CR=1 FL=1
MSNLSTVIQALMHKSDEPLSGYDIAKAIKHKTGNSHQQIYRELGKIARRDDVTVTNVIQYDKPDKTLYSFNSKGDFTYENNDSDFSKTKFGYTLLVSDILGGTNNFDSYIEDLKAVENKYKEMI